MMTNRERFNRLGAMLASVGTVIALVCLFRYGLRQFLFDERRAAAFIESREVDPDIRMIPRRIKLDELVPKALRENIGGVAFDEVQRTVAMPMDLAERVHRNQAEAEGWKTLDQPYANKTAQMIYGQQHYELPDSNFLIRSFMPIDAGNTQVTEIRFPRPEMQSAIEDLGFAEVVTMHSAEVRHQLPEILGEVAVGDVIRTQLLERGQGAAFYLTTLERIPPADHSTMIKAALVRAGWEYQPLLNNAWVKENLAVSFTTDVGRDGIGSVAIYRFTDDEAVAGELKRGGAQS